MREFIVGSDDPQWSESEIRDMWDAGAGKRGVPSFAHFVGCQYGFNMYVDFNRGVYMERNGFTMFYRDDSK